jgi:acyl-coenzyme A synthetase/AMP-(fatty) acid ligase/thioesterase domain-containing protein/acyl carrier protein
MDRFLQRFKQNVAQFGNRVAIADAQRQFTFAELDRASDGLARQLATHTDLPAVGYLRATMPGKFLMAMGSLKAGRPYAVTSPKETQDKIVHVFETARTGLVYVESTEDAAQMRELGLEPLMLHEVPQSTGPLPEHIPATRISWLEPTSGSTGAPKLVGVSRETLEHYLFLQAELGEITEASVIGNFGEQWLDTLLTGLLTGAPTYAHDLKADGIGNLEEWMRSHAITVSHTFISAWRIVCAAVDNPLPDLKNIRVCGEVVRPSDIEDFNRVCLPGAKFTNFLGATECSFTSQFVLHQGEKPPLGPLPVGAPVPGTQLAIIGEDGSEQPPGVTGLVHVRARHLADGYHKNPAKTEGVYWQEADGTKVLNTGDLGHVDGEGRLVLVGRADDQVKIRGYSVRYSEIEAELRAHEGIDEVVVTSFLTERGIRYLSCHYIATTPGLELQLKPFLQDRLPSYMVPNHYVSEVNLPRTGTGKIRRKGLEPPAQTTLQAAHDWSPEERQVAELWRAVLGHGDFGPQDDFFDLGGDSLQAMSMVLDIERMWKKRVGFENLILSGASIRRIVEAAHAEADAPSMLKSAATPQATLHVVPVENGEFSDWLRIAASLNAGIRMQGVHARAHGERSTLPFRSVSDQARHIAETIMAGDTGGRHYIAAYSAGGPLGIETARILKSEGWALDGLILLDPAMPRYEGERWTWRLRRLAGPIKRGKPGQALDRARMLFLRRPTLELAIADETAWRAYRPRRLEGLPVLFFSCMVNNPHEKAKREAWERAMAPDFEVEQVDAWHGDIVRSPFAERVAKRIETWLGM